MTKGAETLTGKLPILESVAGEDYPLRRLGLLDIERLSLIVRKILRSVDALGIKDVTKFTKEAFAGFLIDFMPEAMDEITRFLASIIDLKPGIPFEKAEEKMAKSKAKEVVDPNEGTIRDPSVFPLGSEVRLLKLLTEHPDVVAFFAESRTLKDLPILKTLTGDSSEESTEYNTDTDGQTNISPDED